MKKLSFSLFLTIFFVVIFCQAAWSSYGCYLAITFDRETGDPINAALEVYYPDLDHICAGDCPITGPRGWDRPKH